MSSVINDMVIRFANINGTGSASANNMFAKSIFRMGIPVSPKNIFPSNIQGLPTWYEVRISEKGYLGRREGIDIMVGVNPQSLEQDIRSVSPGGYFIYDSTKKLRDSLMRKDIHFIGIPMMQLCMDNFSDPRKQQLLKNMVYLGALATLINIEIPVIHQIIREQFAKKEKLVESNFLALQLGIDYVQNHLSYPLPFQVERKNLTGNSILIEGNEATALGAIYGGATVVAWYPITPSTSVAQSFEAYANKLRIDPETKKKKFAVVQAEDELAAIGMVIGAAWNGSRAFTATSGPGVSLMSEFLGLAYYAEIPAVLVNVQRGGPSTGMPTRTQQADIISSLYASHGDTKHPLLFPANPAECFELTATALDMADRLQTPIMVMSDLDLGMNIHMSPPLVWSPGRTYDRGKVYSTEDLDTIKTFGRYLDVDGDGICYRTLPGTHPSKGSFFTRGTSRDEYARYSESGETYVRVVDRINKKWETAKQLLPRPEIFPGTGEHKTAILFFGTTTYAAMEAMDILREEGMPVAGIRIRSVPMSDEVRDFIAAHEKIFVVEQNRDAQFRSVLLNELDVSPQQLVSILNYDGQPITADHIVKQIQQHVLFQTQL